MKKQTIMAVLIFILLLCGQVLAGKSDIEQEYLSRLSDINSALMKAHNQWFYDSQLKGRADEAQRKIDALEKEKADLRLDALKYYKGKLPHSLSVKWQEEETRYADFISEYSKKIKQYNQKKKRELQDLQKEYKR